MKAERDKNGKWLIQYRFTDRQGNKKKSTKRGFETKRDAEQWLRDFLAQQQMDPSMTFVSCVEKYTEDMKHRLRENTLLKKQCIIETKVLPFFGKKRLADIKPVDIRHWENAMMQKGYADTYLRLLYNQVNAIFNYAVKYLDLPVNPCAKAGSMGKKNADEMQFWTQEEYRCFADAMMDKPQSYYAFQLLYWCGLREGELLALTPADLDLVKGILYVRHSYQRLHGDDVITPPKTEKSNRKIRLPGFLCEEMQDYLKRLYGVKANDRIFEFTKSYLYNEMRRGCKATGVKQIRIHDLRHSHVSLLASMNYSMVFIANRMGHETIEITQRYAHMFPSEQDEMAEELDEMNRQYASKEENSNVR